MVQLRGVHRLVVDAVTKLVDDDDDKDSGRRWLQIGNVYGQPIARRDAIYIVDKLQELLVKERSRDSNNDSSASTTTSAGSSSSTSTSTSNRTTTTGLSLDFSMHTISQEAAQVFCRFVQQTNDLSALFLVQPHPSLLRALYHNTSVKYLRFQERIASDETGEHIANLLQHKTDFEELYFCDCYFSPSYIFPFLRQGHQSLRSFSFVACCIEDAGVEAILRTLMEGNHHERLKELNFGHNEITSHGLYSLCALNPAVFKCLEKLDLSLNLDLLQDAALSTMFAQQVLMAPGSKLKELNVSYCSTDETAGYAAIVKAALCETNRTPLVLDITRCPTNPQPIRNQLVESLPRAQGLQHLICNTMYLQKAAMNHQRHGDPVLLKAFRQNTSLLELSTHCPFKRKPYTSSPTLLAILKRNKDLRQVDSLLGREGATTTTTTTTSPSPSTSPATAKNASTSTASTTTVIPPGLRSPILNRVGHGSEGASPVFKILQARLASWPETNDNRTNSSSSKKRKRGEDSPTEQQQQQAVTP